MKILLIQKMAGISGSERYFLNLLPALVKRGVDASFLVVQHPKNASKNTSFINELRSANVQVDVINSRYPISPILIWRLAHFIKNRKFDIVQTNLIHADVWGACVKCLFLPRQRIVSVKHGYSEKFQTKHGLNADHLGFDLMSFLTNWAGRYSNKVVCISKALEEFLIQGSLISKDKIITIPYGFDFSGAKTEVPVGGVRFGDPQIVVAGRVVPVKQHHLLIQILPELVKVFPRLSVVMVGAGPLLEGLEKLTTDLGLSSHVRWEGFRENIHDYIRDSDLMVLPSAGEGFGLVVLESWYHGKPVVAFDVPAINEVIETGVDGVLVEPFSVELLKNTLINSISNKRLLSNLGENGKHKQSDVYSLKAMLESTIDAYSELINCQ